MNLREVLIESIARNGQDRSHQELTEFFRALGIEDCNTGTKRERLHANCSSIPDESLTAIAQKYLDRYCRNPAERNKIQDLLWGNCPAVRIPKKHRRIIATVIGKEFYTEGGAEGFDRLLDQLWIIEDPLDLSAFLGVSSPSIKREINQHIHRNQDWDADYLFQRLGVYDASDKRFCLFLEGMASEGVLPDEGAQRAFVKQVDPLLKECGAHFVETGTQGGYPVFEILPLNTNFGDKPKNIIFASEEKPDLRLSDAISNKVQVLSDLDKVLVYDRPISSGGLYWKDLQDWWKETRGIISEQDAKKSLYNRLKSCLPESSPPQRNFFSSYHNHFGKGIPSLPTLLPEVWLYWDHKTIEERGAEALKNLRMDFLMLLPGMTRIVIEVDGRQHYSDGQSVADPKKYAELASGDRDMKLLGYDIYRFGGYELSDESKSIEIVGSFFDRLFQKYQIQMPTS